MSLCMTLLRNIARLVKHYLASCSHSPNYPSERKSLSLDNKSGAKRYWPESEFVHIPAEWS